MLPLIIIFFAVALVVIVSTYIFRRKEVEEADVVINENSECCGANTVCEKTNLQITDTEAEYFDDEELDDLANKKPTEYSQEDIALIENVFYTLQEKDVAPWLKSVQIRNIELPKHIKEEALMIVSELRT